MVQWKVIVLSDNVIFYSTLVNPCKPYSLIYFQVEVNKICHIENCIIQLVHLTKKVVSQFCQLSEEAK